MDPNLGVFLSVDPVTAYEQPFGKFNRHLYANGRDTNSSGGKSMDIPGNGNKPHETLHYD
jgi:hypothetical protein